MSVFHLNCLKILLFSVLFFMIGCNHKLSDSPPLPTFSNPGWASLGGGTGTILMITEAQDKEMQKYIKTYGYKGWIVGLSDKRNYDVATTDGDDEDSSVDRSSAFRVCDYFMIYYVSIHPQAKKDIHAYGLGFSTPEQRDREIEHLIEYIKENLEHIK